MTDKLLFNEFEPVSAKAWKQKIQVDLKGKDYNDTLVWESLEGIKVKPFYHKEDTHQKIPIENSDWCIAQEIPVEDETNANAKALNALKKGAESLIFKLNNEVNSWEVLLKDIDISIAPLYFDFQKPSLESMRQLAQYLNGKKAKAYLNIDPIGHFAHTGNWYDDQEKDVSFLSEVVQLCQKEITVASMAIDASLYQNAGANNTQQLAYALAHAHEYLAQGLQPKPMVFKVGIGNNYFFEIAKLRALRWLWKIVAAEYGCDEECHIIAVPSLRNKSIYDYNVNQLRTTTECMAAVLGGADTVCNLPYDMLYKGANEFSDRIARNQLLMLKEESYFSETTNAAEGSYYIEELTRQLAEKALSLFKQLEQGGGFLAQLKLGNIQRKIKESAQKEQRLFDQGELIAIGTNKFQNKEDRMQHQLERDPFANKDRRKTVIEPILPRRLATNLERERLKTEQG